MALFRFSADSTQPGQGNVFVESCQALVRHQGCQVTKKRRQRQRSMMDALFAWTETCPSPTHADAVDISALVRLGQGELRHDGVLGYHVIDPLFDLQGTGGKEVALALALRDWCSGREAAFTSRGLLH